MSETLASRLAERIKDRMATPLEEECLLALRDFALVIAHIKEENDDLHRLLKEGHDLLRELQTKLSALSS